MNARLFVEAVDTAVRLFYAGAAWVVLTAAVATLALYAVAAVVWWVLCGLWRSARAVWARVRSRVPVSRPESPSRLPCAVRGAPEPSTARTERPAPSWARTEPHRYDNAA